MFVLNWDLCGECSRSCVGAMPSHSKSADCYHDFKIVVSHKGFTHKNGLWKQRHKRNWINNHKCIQIAVNWVFGIDNTGHRLRRWPTDVLWRFICRSDVLIWWRELESICSPPETRRKPITNNSLDSWCTRARIENFRPLLWGIKLNDMHWLSHPNSQRIQIPVEDKIRNTKTNLNVSKIKHFSLSEIILARQKFYFNLRGFFQLNRKQKVFKPKCQCRKTSLWHSQGLWKWCFEKVANFSLNSFKKIKLSNVRKPLRLVNQEIHSKCRQRTLVEAPSIIYQATLHFKIVPFHACIEKETINKSINRSDCQPNWKPAARKANQKIPPKLNSLLSKL